MHPKLLIVQPTPQIIKPDVPPPILKIINPKSVKTEFAKHPKCNGNHKKLCKNDCAHCYNKSFASFSSIDKWSERNEKSPRNLFRRSGEKYWFKCNICSHDYECSLHNITRKGKRCPYCSNKNLCSSECDKCFNKSFASSNRAIYWSVKNDVSPRETFKSSSKKYWFKCDKCLHDFETSLTSITGSSTWCPYCANTKLCVDNKCIICFNNSFASCEKSKYWSNKNDKTPREIFIYSCNKYWFKCNICSHDFDGILGNINGHDQWCPYCVNQKLCNDNNCIMCFNNSFASYEKSKYWSEKNEIHPRNVFLNAHKKYLFKCERGHEFESPPHDISTGRWCPKCKNKTEKKLYEILSNSYNIIHHPKYDWCRNLETGHHFPFDFELEDYKIIIELDGEQHFKQIANWQSPEENVKRDIYKMDKANENGYTVIRIFQVDVYRDRNSWLEKLTKAIKLYEIPTRIFISSGDQYINHIK